MFKGSFLSFKNLLALFLSSFMLFTSSQAWSDDAFFSETFGNYQEELEQLVEEKSEGQEDPQNLDIEDVLNPSEDLTQMMQDNEEIISNIDLNRVETDIDAAFEENL